MRREATKLGCVLAIGGLDPGGGAGIAADLRAFHACGLFGCAAVALLTVQSTNGLRASHPVAAKLLLAQATEVMEAQRVVAIKMGALGSVSNVRAVAKWLEAHPQVPVVLDPVMAPTRGSSRLLAERATAALRDELVPRVTLVTANAHEAEALTGSPVRSVAQATRAAQAIVALGATAALVKGGHLTRSPKGEAVDVLAERNGSVTLLREARLKLAPTHGGGCVLASLIAGQLAWGVVHGKPSGMLAAVRRARRLHRRALEGSVDVGGALRVLVPW